MQRGRPFANILPIRAIINPDFIYLDIYSNRKLLTTKTTIVMTKKKDVKKYVAEIEIKSIHSQLVPARKKGRSPKHVGQGRHKERVRLHGISLKELKKRIDLAKAVLETGKLPKEKKKEEPKAPKIRTDAEKVRKLQIYLQENDVKFHHQMGEKKLQALVNEHKASKPQPPPE